MGLGSKRSILLQPHTQYTLMNSLVYFVWRRHDYLYLQICVNISTQIVNMPNRGYHIFAQ